MKGGLSNLAESILRRGGLPPHFRTINILVSFGSLLVMKLIIEPHRGFLTFLSIIKGLGYFLTLVARCFAPTQGYG